jgi:uncharacterized protein (DUF697 family)
MLPNIIKQVLDNFNFDINPELTQEQNVEEVTRSAALLSGAIAVEPLPFADILLITPLQMKMVAHIGLIYGFKLDRSRIKDIVAELGATFAFGFLARQLVRGAAKIVAPVIGGLITAPAVYGSTFALGKLAEGYFKAQLEGKNLGKLEAKQVAQKALEDAKSSAPTVKALGELAQSLRERVKKLEGKSETVEPAQPPSSGAFEGEILEPTEQPRKLN